MKVLSLFDGISCGRQALHNLGVTDLLYHASEIDIAPMKISDHNWKNIIHVGNIKYLKELPHYDLVMGGSPCQGFSKLGNQRNFDHPKSKLYFEFTRILEEVKPTYFLLENVKMKEEWRDFISKDLGVKPIKINSNVHSAQNRTRYYWTNIPFLGFNESQVNIKDILESSVHERFYLNNEQLSKLTLGFDLNMIDCDLRAFLTERRTKKAIEERALYRKATGKDYCPRRGKEIVCRTDHKSNCLTATLSREHLILDRGRIRYSTPTEWERLQNLPEGYTDAPYVTDRQRYKALGNAWNVKTIECLLKGLL